MNVQSGNSVRREPASWNIIAGVGYSFLLMLVALVIQLVIHLFLPAVSFEVALCPFYALATGRIIATVSDVLVYASAAFYNSSRTSKVWEESQTNTVARWTVVALIFASAIFDFTGGDPIQTRVGAFILSGLVAGGVGGLLARRLSN
ncbi:hypothetical protein B9Q03_11005 [Candidatus Marsarchaeota G2 archaeon OSP_D]|jgi:hypothetical protein|uniref:Uncharacterized protein n=5 Tax=Candidatus Marsarchaeota group 2 TaxID=2203771 RepID=A0A2R6BBZ8_9ARCH|nr:MAG: hypothetical protein B9Q03_11005 [Candidatus Marsarchaeota G2 archaeon OSP_D]PSN90427.1 MAG: hypothetical protein B9Q08_04725 [Candidatus Marsarchaeota G2 archaeon ECH_B_SAG-M15]PSN94622.1 MAG: hypothetical protein B9Q06_08575 [Candidatus Marsarchaeota G2 archaeon ECH_B_2]PSN98343.1 MAG: hypothetical protein B9Q07_10025 [Candidatus Marsarchaeota G2 archaeon ECH_B_3]PSO02648.1 MAG: hypothetical protein B9Q05_03855 [Candidatus Marsarchaeota G2 archaeon ECH_B_1]